MLLINDDDVRELLSYDLCMQAIRKALIAVSNEKAVQPMRQMIRVPGGNGIMGWMPGYAEMNEGQGALGLKLISVFPLKNQPTRSSHQGVVLLYDDQDGTMAAMIEAGEITAIRTPAASAVATDALARKDARTLAILGSGHQAKGHLAALLLVRNFDRIIVWDINEANAQDFAKNHGQLHECKIEVASSVRHAVRDADVICTTTAAPEPILEYGWIKPGAHVNVIGSSIPMTSEIDIDTVAKTSFFVDHRETIEVQGGDYRRALQAGAISPGHIKGEIGEILSGHNAGRVSDNEITVYKSVGIVAYDLVAAHATCEAAKAQGKGLEFKLMH